MSLCGAFNWVEINFEHAFTPVQNRFQSQGLPQVGMFFETPESFAHCDPQAAHWTVAVALKAHVGSPGQHMPNLNGRRKYASKEISMCAPACVR